MQQQQWDPLRTRRARLTTATAARDPAEARKQLVAVAATAPGTDLMALSHT